LVRKPNSSSAWSGRGINGAYLARANTRNSFSR
jgi:hypothetical protein